MKIKTNPYAFALAALLILPAAVDGQDTFSICAVDLATGQVGSAGATCITSGSVSAIIISDVHPGTGVVHTQAYWLAANQNYANSLMNLGLAPQQIVDSLVAHDVQGNPAIRQYGVVTLAGGGQSAAYTGVNCDNYKNHLSGPGYAIQGNILLGQQILDSMESVFLNTQGSLACRLMAALQGAKVPGADTRCLSFGISSYSAFIRVANPNDPPGNLYLDLTVNTYPGNKEPIDSLQALFNAWGGCSATFVQSASKQEWLRLYPNPVTGSLHISYAEKAAYIEISSLAGTLVRSMPAPGRRSTIVETTGLPMGAYLVRVGFENGSVVSTRLIKE